MLLLLVVDPFTGDEMKTEVEVEDEVLDWEVD